jgi:hypothetical protein
MLLLLKVPRILVVTEGIKPIVVVMSPLVALVSGLLVKEELRMREARHGCCLRMVVALGLLVRLILVVLVCLCM